MAVKEFRFSSEMAAQSHIVFAVVADLPNYSRWLADSSAFGGTNTITPYPIRVGTTYVEAPPVEKQGVVTEFEPPSHIGFHQVAQVRRPISVDVDARIRYSFEPRDRSTLVIRELRLTWESPGLFKIATPLLVWGFQKENLRTLSSLKRYVESL